jgi:hypothetical protein
VIDRYEGTALTLFSNKAQKSGVLVAECISALRVDELDYKRFLRLPHSRSLDGLLAANAAWAREWFNEFARPWYALRLFPSVTELNNVKIANTIFASSILTKRLAGVNVVAVIAASAGLEPEAESLRRWQMDEPDRYYFMECYASVAVESLLFKARKRVASVCRQSFESAHRHYCPGFHGWSIADNVPLLALLTEGVVLPGPLEVLESGSLWPKKSQLGIQPCGPDTAFSLEKSTSMT